MHRDDLGPLLASEEMIEPSPGFTAAVMGAVRREAETPAPIAFPWRRVLPGLLLAGAGLVVGIVVLVGALLTAPAPATTAAWTAPAWLTSQRLWTLATLACSLLVPWLAVRLSRAADPTIL